MCAESVPEGVPEAATLLRAACANDVGLLRALVRRGPSSEEVRETDRNGRVSPDRVWVPSALLPRSHFRVTPILDLLPLRSPFPSCVAGGDIGTPYAERAGDGPARLPTSSQSLYRPEDPRILPRGRILHAGNVLTSGVGGCRFHPVSPSLLDFSRPQIGDGLHSHSGDIILPQSHSSARTFPLSLPNTLVLELGFGISSSFHYLRRPVFFLRFLVARAATSQLHVRSPLRVEAKEPSEPSSRQVRCWAAQRGHTPRSPRGEVGGQSLLITPRLRDSKKVSERARKSWGAVFTE